MWRACSLCFITLGGLGRNHELRNSNTIRRCADNGDNDLGFIFNYLKGFQEMTTYIVTPTRRDFLRYCENHELDIKDKNLIQLSRPETLLGRAVRASDTIEYYRVECFRPDIIKRIEQELKLRMIGK